MTLLTIEKGTKNQRESTKIVVNVIRAKQKMSIKKWREQKIRIEMVLLQCGNLPIRALQQSVDENFVLNLDYHRIKMKLLLLIIRVDVITFFFNFFPVDQNSRFLIES